MEISIDGDTRRRKPDPEPDLRPALAIERRPDGQLVAWRGNEATLVRLFRCFPWSAPTTHLSLRDDDDEEVALVHDAADLDADSREAICGALVEAGFVLEVTGVDDVEEDFEMRLFRVRTRQGARAFQTARDAWPRPGPDGGLLLEDVQGDIFWFPPRERLDAASREKLWAFLD